MTATTHTEAQYRVTLTHPTGFHKEPSYTIRVVTEVVDDGHGGTYTKRYCSAFGFGCSRDFVASYGGPKDDKAAIRVWLLEHACTLVKATKIPSRGKS